MSQPPRAYRPKEPPKLLPGANPARGPGVRDTLCIGAGECVGYALMQGWDTLRCTECPLTSGFSERRRADLETMATGHAEPTMPAPAVPPTGPKESR